MPIISINEVDKTTSGVLMSSTDIVFIPGFVAETATSGIAADEPLLALFKNSSDFKNKVCSTPVQLQAAGENTPAIEDTGYHMAKSLLDAGLQVLYMGVAKVSGTASDNIDRLYDAMNVAFGGSSSESIAWKIPDISDVGTYDIKYVTSGGYATYGHATGETTDAKDIYSQMLTFASNRGDCVALIDYTKEKTLANLETEIVQRESEIANGTYGAMFAPWATYEGGVEMPASFAYLRTLAESIKTNPNWLAVAGAARGLVTGVEKYKTPISNKIANSFQPTSEGTAINAITHIRPYGDAIWGNRTLTRVGEGIVATDCLNIRNMISDIKKTCYTSAKACMFEPDSEVTWVNFKSRIIGLLDRMKSGYGISAYRIVRDTEHIRATENGTICAKIIIYPTFAVESFYITVVLQNDEVTVEE